MAGTLIDSEIIAAVKNGELISEGFDSNNVKQACYELTLGDVYFDLTDGNKRLDIPLDISGQQRFRRTAFHIA